MLREVNKASKVITLNYYTLEAWKVVTFTQFH